MARGTKLIAKWCGFCADICDAGAAECSKFSERALQDCAAACRRCAQECRQVAPTAYPGKITSGQLVCLAYEATFAHAA